MKVKFEPIDIPDIVRQALPLYHGNNKYAIYKIQELSVEDLNEICKEFKENLFNKAGKNHKIMIPQ